MSEEMTKEKAKDLIIFDLEKQNKALKELIKTIWNKRYDLPKDQEKLLREVLFGEKEI